ncbi:MAG TPA: hypothetical protein PKE45_21410 [Caldilineaceae bacterium]|nr:hypothetical protein [Caldilineaceae bacterium]
MHVVTKQELIATVAERWLDTYYARDHWQDGPANFDPEIIYHQLKALPATANEEAVTAITGQPWWTANICHECGLDREVTVGFGQEPHHPLDVKYLCPTCLQKALALVRT